MKNESISIISDSVGANNVRISLSGQLIIKNATAIKKQLLSALNEFKNIEVVLTNVIRIDLAVLQLLIALKKSSSAIDKNLSFDIELTDYLKSALKNSGLDKILIPNFQSPI